VLLTLIGSLLEQVEREVGKENEEAQVDEENFELVYQVHHLE